MALPLFKPKLEIGDMVSLDEVGKSFRRLKQTKIHVICLSKHTIDFCIGRVAGHTKLAIPDYQVVVRCTNVLISPRNRAYVVWRVGSRSVEDMTTTEAPGPMDGYYIRDLWTTLGTKVFQDILGEPSRWQLILYGVVGVLVGFVLCMMTLAVL